MIGNLSFEEHDRYFTKMYNCLKHAGQNWDLFTILEAIECKVILDQKRENIKHNLNIKDVCDTPMVKDFETWSDWLCLRNIDSQNENSQNENLQDEDSQDEDSQDEDSQNEDSQNEDSQNENSQDENSQDEDSQDEDSQDEDSQDEDSQDEDSQNEDSQNEDSQNEDSQDEDSQDDDSQDENEDSQNEDEDEDDDNYNAFEEFCRSSEASNGVLRYRPIPPEIPEGY